jgi:hypothetical protein
MSKLQGLVWLEGRDKFLTFNYLIRSLTHDLQVCFSSKIMYIFDIIQPTLTTTLNMEADWLLFLFHIQRKAEIQFSVLGCKCCESTLIHSITFSFQILAN